jgi:hypothetical protein
MGKVGRFVVDASEASWSDYFKPPERKYLGEWSETLLSDRTEMLLPWNARGRPRAAGFLNQNNKRMSKILILQQS